MNRPLAHLIPMALAAALAAAPALAQQSPAADQQDHSTHHPDAQAPAPAGKPAPDKAGTTGAKGAGGMMSGQVMMGPEMAQMMSMMQNRGDMMGGLPFEHIEGRLAFLKTELKITPAQEAQWGKFADAVRTAAKSMKTMHETAAASAEATAVLDRYERSLAARLDMVRLVKGAFGPLYAAFTDEQKKTADELLGRMPVL